MEQFTIKDLRKLSPCYDPTKYLPEDWQGTVLDILNVTCCPAEDRLWVVLRNEFMTDKQLRLFAVWCIRQELAMPGDSKISINIYDIAKRYVNGEATDDELANVSDASWAASAAAWAKRTARTAGRTAAWAAWASSVASFAAMDARSAQINHLKIMLA